MTQRGREKLGCDELRLIYFFFIKNEIENPGCMLKIKICQYNMGMPVLQ